jgi:hypothetical protein
MRRGARRHSRYVGRGKWGWHSEHAGDVRGRNHTRHRGRGRHTVHNRRRRRRRSRAGHMKRGRGTGRGPMMVMMGAPRVVEVAATTPPGVTVISMVRESAWDRPRGAFSVLALIRFVVVHRRCLVRAIPIRRVVPLKWGGQGLEEVPQQLGNIPSSLSFGISPELLRRGTHCLGHVLYGLMQRITMITPVCARTGVVHDPLEGLSELGIGRHSIVE